jgi:hypothetical protein
VVIYPSRVKMVLALLAVIGFVALGIWIGTSGDASPLQLLIVSYLGVPAWSACGLYGAYRLVRHRPAVEADSTGMTVGMQCLRWEEVARLRLFKYYGKPMLGIIPKDLEGFLIRQHPVRRCITKLNLRLGCDPVNIPQATLRMKLAELAALLHSRYGVRVESEL